MQGSSRRGRLTVTLGSLGLLALGLSVMVNPIGAPEDGVALVGWILAIMGALSLLGAAIQDGLPPRGGWPDVAVGVADLVLGIVLVAAAPALTGAVWPILGACVLASGAHMAADAPALGVRVAGVATAILGAAVIAAFLANPVLGMLAACLALVLAGAVQLVCSFWY